MKAVTLARWEDRFRPWLVRLPSSLPVRVYSAGRPRFLKYLIAERPAHREPPREFSKVLWGLTFRFPLGNAAGMFKNGHGYELVAAQGAGYFLAGTTTAQPRRGNRRHGVAQPFAPYPRSHGASNWLGLPNEGHARVAARLAAVQRVAGCPLGASLAVDPEGPEGERLAGLLLGLKQYAEAGVDFLEINESCPNTEQGPTRDGDLSRRLEFLREEFLEKRDRTLPVVVKFSCDTPLEQVPALVDLLLDLGFDGVDFGNSSARHDHWRDFIHSDERKLYDHFRHAFGGGFSGRPLKEISLSLAAAAAAQCQRRAPGREFHVVRTGGVEGGADLAAAERFGVSLSGWYTGYFASFSEAGHGVYESLWQSLQEEGGMPSSEASETRQQS